MIEQNENIEVFMLTLKQNQLLNFLIVCIEKYGVSPSYEEICEELDLKSKSGIHRIVKSLEERGYIERLENKARAIAPKKHPNGQIYNSVVINFKDKFINKHSHSHSITEKFKSKKDQIPLLGKIAAGSPIEAISNHGEYLEVPSSLLTSENCYALYVEGDSMIDEGIFDGDTIIINKKTNINIVVDEDLDAIAGVARGPRLGRADRFEVPRGIGVVRVRHRGRVGVFAVVGAARVRVTVDASCFAAVAAVPARADVVRGITLAVADGRQGARVGAVEAPVLGRRAGDLLTARGRVALDRDSGVFSHTRLGPNSGYVLEVFV